MVFLQDADTKEAFDSNGRADHAFLTGTPKIDALLEAKDKVEPAWPIERTLSDGTKPMRVIWAPHHSYGASWLNFGHFTNQKDSMLEYAQKNPDIDIVLRPHPFLFGTLTGRDLMSSEELTDWRLKWDLLPNTFTDIDGPFTSLALASDVMITDGVSFIAEYPLVTRKSVIFWEKPDHWEFSPLGKIAAATTHTVSSMAQVTEALELAKAGTLAPKVQEIDALIKAVRPGKTSAATAIVSLVLGDYTSDKGD
jgi:CDP-glycerol glycerophosphotransferase (TagB/SpsB family)